MSKKLTNKKKDSEIIDRLITKYNKSITMSDANLLKLQKAGSMTNFISKKYQAAKLSSAILATKAKQSLGNKYKKLKSSAQSATLPYAISAMQLKDKLKKKTHNAVDLATDLGGNLKRSYKSTTKSLKKLTPSLEGKSLKFNKILKQNNTKKLVESDLDFLLSYYNSTTVSPTNYTNYTKYLTYINNILEIKIKIIDSFVNNINFINKSKTINILLDNNVLNFVKKYIGDWSESYISKLQQGGSILSSMRAAATSATKAIKSTATSATKAIKSTATSATKAAKKAIASVSSITPNYITQEKNKIPVDIIELEIINNYTNSMKNLLKQCYIDNYQYYTTIKYSQDKLLMIAQLQSYTKVCIFLANATGLFIKNQKGNVNYNTVTAFINNLNNLYKTNGITVTNVTGFDNILKFINQFDPNLKII